MPKKKKKSRSTAAADDNYHPSSKNNTHLNKFRQPTRDDEGVSTTIEQPMTVVTTDILPLMLAPGSAALSSSLSTSTTTTTTTTSPLKYTPTVVLHEGDARQLDVTNGDKVFVVSYHNNDDASFTSLSSSSLSPFRLSRTAMARVKIWNEHEAATSIQSPTNSSRYSTPTTAGKKTSKGNKASSCSVGRCRLYPKTLADYFFNCFTQQKDDVDDDDDNGTVIPSTPTSAITPPATTTTNNNRNTNSPQTSNAKFSFAIGGGGWDNAMGTPSPGGSSSTAKKKKPSTATTTTATVKNGNVLLVPVDSELGDQIAAQLCCKAQSVAISVATKDEAVAVAAEASPSSFTNTTSSSSRSSTRSFSFSTGRMAQRVILAYIVDEYVSTSSGSDTAAATIQISLQGRSALVRIQDVQTTTTTALTSTLATSNCSTTNDDKNCIISAADTVLTQGIERLSLQDQDNKNWEGKLLRALQALDERERQALMLYRVCHDTKIQFIADGDTKPSSQSCVETSPQQRDKPQQLVVGLDTVLQQVQSSLEITLCHPELFQQSGSITNFNTSSLLRPPKGVLLHGPSGVGKSRLAQQIGRHYEALGFVVESVHCTSLQSQTAFVGQAEQQLVRLFRKVQQPRVGKKGCLLILDDVHLICPRRQGTNVGADRLASTLLALLDGIDTKTATTNDDDSSTVSYNPMAILAVTTNPGSLDAALRRPGRLDAEVEVSVPDEPSTRADILKFQLQYLEAAAQLPSFTEAEWLSLARLAKGFTGADLTLAAKEAVRRSYNASHNNNNNNNIPSNNNDVDVVTLEILQSAIRSIKPSAIKAVTVEVPRVPWSSIGGMDDVKTQLREAIELPLTHAATFQKLGIRPPRGVLLYGPPGCSKTLMARALATEGHMNFLAVKGPELLSKWLGESERALAALFRRARLASPAVIFFDEVDAIASKRGGSGSSGGGERLLSQLLTELDGVHGATSSGNGGGRVVIVCATNRPDLLDSALMRPGRIDRMIYVGVPDRKSRDRILRIGLEGKSCAENIDFSMLVEENVSGGLSGAELIAACRDSALKAMEEFEDALEDAADSDTSNNSIPMIRMDHLLSTLREMERQITPEMIEFYASFSGKAINK